MCNPLAMMTNKMGEAIPLPGATELSTGSPRAVCTPTLTAALFASQKQNVVHPYNGMLLGLIGEGRSDTCRGVEHPGGHDAE